MLGQVAEDDMTHRGRRVQGVVLGQHPDGQPTRAGHPARVDLAGTLEHPQQGRLAATVATDDADAVTARHAEGEGVEHLRGAEGQRRGLDRDEVDH